jgi:membrane protease YdiL (CAAX protease family)
MFGTAVLTQWAYDRIGFEHPNAHQLLRLLGHDSGMAMRVAVVISAAVLAPLFEEMLFRGHMQTAILYTISRPQSDSPRVRWAAIFITSIFFTLVHGELWLMPCNFQRGQRLPSLTRVYASRRAYGTASARE